MPNLTLQLELPRCPHCGIDKPLLSYTTQFESDRYSGHNKRLWRTYTCKTCGGAILAASRQADQAVLEMYPAGSKETFDFEYLPPPVSKDFQEALSCYSIGSYNAFAAMSRRTVQSVSTDLGAKGSDKVLNQLQDLKEMAQIDDATFEVLKQIIISGHDGAHPHLPKLSPERAGVLLELMKDVLYQLYIRKAKVQKAIALRNKSKN